VTTPASPPWTPQERRLTVLLRVLAAAFGLAVFAYLLPALVGPWRFWFVKLPFVTNSVVKIGVLGLLAWFASADVRRYRLLVVLLIVGHLISLLSMVTVLLWGDVTDPVVDLRTVLWGAMLLDGMILTLLIWFSTTAERARYDLKYLSPLQLRGLTALAEVSITGADGFDPVLSAEEAARNVDRYLSAFKGRSKWVSKLDLMGLELYPLLSFRPPLSHLEPGARRRFIERRFYKEVGLRLTPALWRFLIRAMIEMGKQLCYLGYYNDARTFDSIGYVPFSKRKEAAERMRQSPIPPRMPLDVDAPLDVHSEVVTADVVIVGSGAAASILAHGLAERGREVLLLERGSFVDPSQFTEDEAEMLGKLYADGALQLTKTFDFQVLQGSCVGGSTVVNNAVCFKLPEEVLERWNDPDSLDAGLDPAGIWSSFEHIWKLIHVQPQNHDNLNRGARYFKSGIESLKLGEPPNQFHFVDANIQGCLGCGYCNIGCKYGKKLSMLDTILPMTQHDFPGRLRILSDCEAERLRAVGKRITAVRCRLGDGRLIEVRGNTFVVAGGALSSSVLLLRSGAGGKRVGKQVSFNMGSPMAALFDRVVDSYDGLQISHYLELSPGRGYVLETWFNPPVAQSLSMPGWFEDHFRNMRRYNRMTSTGVLVGTESNAEAVLGGLTGRQIDYKPTPADLAKLVEGLILTGRIYFAGGAQKVMPSTFQYYEFGSPEELAGLRDLVRDASDITIGTGHPQGGNAVSKRPERGVVDPQFRVWGYDNLFVCDASVFPSSIGVNPQLTVMALAHYATPFVAAAQKPGHV
jgi:choline dehydrogenase-like flavoprotein